MWLRESGQIIFLNPHLTCKQEWKGLQLQSIYNKAVTWALASFHLRSCGSVSWGQLSPWAMLFSPPVLWPCYWNPEQALCKAWVLASCSCYNKLPQTWWLKTTEIYSFTGLEARSLKSRGQQSWFLPQRFWGESIPCFSPSFWCLPAILGIPRFVAASLCNFISVVTWPPHVDASHRLWGPP